MLDDCHLRSSASYRILSFPALFLLSARWHDFQQDPKRNWGTRYGTLTPGCWLAQLPRQYGRAKSSILKHAKSFGCPQTEETVEKLDADLKFSFLLDHHPC